VLAIPRRKGLQNWGATNTDDTQHDAPSSILAQNRFFDGSLQTKHAPLANSENDAENSRYLYDASDVNTKEAVDLGETTLQPTTVLTTTRDQPTTTTTRAQGSSDTFRSQNQQQQGYGQPQSSGYARPAAPLLQPLNDYVK
jgi:hypothetical protein